MNVEYMRNKQIYLMIVLNTIMFSLKHQMIWLNAKMIKPKVSAKAYRQPWLMRIYNISHCTGFCSVREFNFINIRNNKTNSNETLYNSCYIINTLHYKL